MKQEQRATVEQQITWQQEKLKNIYHKIDGCIDRFIEIYCEAERAVESAQDHVQVIEQLNKQLIHLRPLKTVREHFVHHYRRLSNLIRKIQMPTNKYPVANSRYSRKTTSQQGNNQTGIKEADQKFNQFFKTFINKMEDYEILDEMIVENYLRKGEWECANVWPNLESKIDPSSLFRESITLRDSIKKGRLVQAIRWCQNERLFETYDCYLEYDLKLIHLLGQIEKGNLEETLIYVHSLNKFQAKKKQIQKLCLHVFFKINNFWDTGIDDFNFSQKINQRYQIFQYSQKKLENLAQQFFDQFLKHNNLCKFNGLSIIFNCSQKIIDQYMRMMKLVWGGKEKSSQKKQPTILPFSVKIQREYQYHSLFFCPVTKEVHSSNQSSKLLACGHLISDSAHNRIVHENRNRRKIKCPICQKQIRPQDSLKTQF